jgi:dipeptidyl-peptidase-4
MNIKLSALTLLVSASAIAQQTSITLQDIWYSGKFRSEYVYGLRSMNDGEHYTAMARSADGPAVVKYAYATGEPVDTLVRASAVTGVASFDDYAFSADEKQLLLKTETESIYRYSTREFNTIYNLETGELKSLATDAKQRYATFSPQGDRIAYVKKNDLFMTDLATGKESRLTADGEANKIINGATDWVYEEEFAIAQGFFWSPDGKHIAFMRFDESEVVEFNMPVFGADLYPQDYRFKYPKAGEANSVVELKLYNTETGETNTVASTQGDAVEYMPRVKWVNDGELVFQQLNRHQNKLEIVKYNVADGDAKTVYEESSDTYIDVIDGWQLVGKELLITSERSGFNHIYGVNVSNGTVRGITGGNYDVTDFYGADEKYVYYRSAEESPMNRQVYRIGINGKNKQTLTEYLGWNDADFSTGMKYFINRFSDANNPGGYELRNASGKAIRMLKDNERLKNTLADEVLATKEFIKIPTENGIELNGWMMKPASFDNRKQYPVLLCIYGGPGSQQVTDQWGGANYLWHQHLTELGYIVVSVDNRGTGARGAEFKKQTYQNLGHLELIDYLKTAEYLGQQNYIDASRIGIWGWSYGGYMSSLAATKGEGAFKAAIAVAPVTTWRFYDNIYTERYMRTPQENPTGYDENSPINFADGLSSNYLIIHGTADDNVHFQNAARMVNALVQAGKQFDSFYYPDRNHGIYGGNTRLHIYELMTDWLKENL